MTTLAWLVGSWLILAVLFTAAVAAVRPRKDRDQRDDEDAEQVTALMAGAS